ncbi:hypothetical protein VTN49DRAFT_5336 [Thermomyces lanuginosus]|uniref:uncharacterized protein n=1 Tax=Thermomyces lanuginosus TaxID=5541 RepID=UPI0037446F3E
MPSANGELHASSGDQSAPLAPAKRKRASSTEDPQTSHVSDAAAGQETDELGQALRYILQILARDDEDLHVFTTPLGLSSPSKPRNKRAKLADGEKPTTIETSVASGRYTSLAEFRDDVERAATTVLEQRQSARRTGQQNEIVGRIVAFKKRVEDLVLRASTQISSKVKSEAEEETGVSNNAATLSTGREDKRVLTLFGNPSNPRQLFSSLQQPTKVPTSEGRLQEAEFPEDKLPNGITAVKAVPYNLEMDERPVRTFGEVFAPRPNLPQLEPPRRAESWARDLSTMWIDAFDAATNLRAVLGEKHNYTFTPVPTVHWLQYGGAALTPGHWSQREKRAAANVANASERSRLQSDHYNAEDDLALIQSAYSSFAPSYDSSNATIPVSDKNMAWWRRKGARRFNLILSLHQGATAEKEEEGQLETLDESTLEETVKSFNPDDFAESIPASNAEKEPEPIDPQSKEVDEMLSDITELLETLNSYRQARILNALPSAKSSADVDSLDTPSAAERAVYETLRSSLAAIISTLPPYAVAKLNGDQLADLNISKKILMETPAYNGTMEDDDWTNLQKRLAAVTPRAGAYQPSPAYNPRAMYPSNSRGAPQPPPPNTPGAQGYFAGRHHPSTPAAAPYTPGTPAAVPQPNYAGARAQATPSPRPGHVPAPATYAPNSPYNARPPSNGFPAPPYGGAQKGPAGPMPGSPQVYAPRQGQPQPQPGYQPGRVM